MESEIVFGKNLWVIKTPLPSCPVAMTQAMTYLEDLWFHSPERFLLRVNKILTLAADTEQKFSCCSSAPEKLINMERMTESRRTGSDPANHRAERHLKASVSNMSPIKPLSGEENQEVVRMEG